VADEHTRHLRALATRLAAGYVERAGAVAALLVGSAAAGTADEWSDIDLVLFYDAWPAPGDLERVRADVTGTDHIVLGGSTDHDESGGVYLEQYRVGGVACQCVHQTVAAWRRLAASVRDELDTATPSQKALSGLHAGVVLTGDDVIGDIRAEAAYPEALRRAMIRDHLDVFPLWRLQPSLSRRDAELWQRGELVAGLQKVLAILAGVNRVYFSTFQLKHLRELTAALHHAPPDLANRIDAALVAPMDEAALALERLVAQTLELVGRQLPDVDVEPLRRHLGARLTPWAPTPRGG
jgi:hypothetical protein